MKHSANASEASPGSWHLKLFSKSVLKQAKLASILEFLPPPEERICLDLGSDNGVISYYLRKQGGEWYSADLTNQAVESIRSLVGDKVRHIDGKQLPFPDNYFHAVVIVDMLEHVEDDRRLVAEIARVLKPGGTLIVNTPNRKPFSPLRGFRHLIGQTDEAHGHLRPGYSAGELESVLAPHFRVVKQKTYSRFFAELIDTGIVLAYTVLAGKSHASGAEGEVSKGLVVTEEGMKKYEKNFKLYSLIYPLVWLISKLDLLLFFLPGFMRICQAKQAPADAA